MKRSAAFDRMRNGETINCFKFNLDGFRAVQLAGMMGFDCFWVDTEHTPNSIDLVERQVLAARAAGVDIIVRVPRGSYSDIIHPLEMDASGVMVPHVMNVADARQVARMAKFGPLGRRPVDGGNADGMFGMVPFKDYAHFVNGNRMLIVQIEDPEPMEELEEICAVEGVDMVFFGPGDYSSAIGAPGELRHPEVDKARIRVAEAARRHGKLAGTTGSPQTFAEYRKLGYSLINVGADIHGLKEYCSRLLEELKDANQI